MKFSMSGFTRKQLQIINSVIRYVTINMMNNLLGLQKTANVLFHYKPMLHNVSIAIRKRMIWLEYQYISVLFLGSSIFPIVVFNTASRNHFSKLRSFLIHIYSYFSKFFLSGFCVKSACKNLSKFLFGFFGTRHTFSISRLTNFCSTHFQHRFPAMLGTFSHKISFFNNYNMGVELT